MGSEHQTEHSDTLVLIPKLVSGGKTEVTVEIAGERVFIDKVDLGSNRSRKSFAKAVSQEFPAVDVSELRAELNKLACKPPAEPAVVQPQEIKDDPEIIAKAEALLRDNNLLAELMNHFEEIGVVGEPKLATTLYLTGTSRLLSKPLAAIVQGASSGGKSHAIKTVAKLFPPETRVSADSMTPQALVHMPEGSLKNRFVVAGERSRQTDDDQAEATRGLREMISSGRLSKLMPIKTPNGIESILIEQEGPIAFVESTTLADNKIFEEDLNRCLLLSIDESAEQTGRIVDTLAERETGEQSNSVGEIVAIHHALQRHLESREIVIPFARKLANHFPRHRIEVRRAFPHTISLIKAITLLHQRQRSVDSSGRLIAESIDYEHAYSLLRQPLSRLTGEIPNNVRDFLDVLQSHLDLGDEFTPKSAGKWNGHAKSTTSRKLKALSELNIIEPTEWDTRQRVKTWRFNGTGGLETSVLPEPSLIQGPLIRGTAKQSV